MSVKLRQIIEKEITAAVVDDLLQADLWIAVDTGSDQPDYIGQNKAKIVEAAMACDEARLYVYQPNEVDMRRGKVAVLRGASYGWVYLVYGNSGYDLVSDYTTNLEKVLKTSQALADKYGE